MLYLQVNILYLESQHIIIVTNLIYSHKFGIYLFLYQKTLQETGNEQCCCAAFPKMFTVKCFNMYKIIPYVHESNFDLQINQSIKFSRRVTEINLSTK